MSDSHDYPGDTKLGEIAFQMAVSGIEDLREGGYLTDDEADRFIEAEKQFYLDAEENGELIESHE